MQFRPVVYETLIKLCTDICRRNGKKKLLWFGDKDKTLKYTPKADEMVLTVHRWFAKTDLFNRTGSFKKVSINGRNNLNLRISGLTKGQTYYFRIRCYVNYTHSVTKKTTKTWSQYSDVISVKITK